MRKYKYTKQRVTIINKRRKWFGKIKHDKTFEKCENEIPNIYKQQLLRKKSFMSVRKLAGGGLRPSTRQKSYFQICLNIGKD